jgi:hypothetical protein
MTTGANARSPISSSASRRAWRRQATNCCCSGYGDARLG